MTWRPVTLPPPLHCMYMTISWNSGESFKPSTGNRQGNTALVKIAPAVISWGSQG